MKFVFNINKISVLFVLILITPSYSIGQKKLDTLYYDKDWKGVNTKDFATYFRIIEKNSNDNFQKWYKDYYITGEIQAEGYYKAIYRYDDSKSIFDGEYVTYYKSGKVESTGTRVNGLQDGEYTEYKEDGLIVTHAYFRKGMLNGVYTEFTEDDLCIQIEYKNGKPRYNYCIISNKEGFCSKIDLETKQPIYEAPTLEEKLTEYKDGEAWPYYNKNGIMVGMTNNEVRDYGKYFQIPIIIANNSMFPIDFDPEEITASLQDLKGYEYDLKVYSAAEYMKKVRRQQNWAIALTAFAESMAASSAGYSSSTTTSTYSGHSSSYGSASAYGSGGYAFGSYSGSTSYSGSSTSKTTSYNGAAAYQAQIIASNRIAAYENALLSERAAKNEGYLKKTTIYPGEIISGYIHIQRKKGRIMYINININNAIYTFPWNINRKK